VNDKIAKLAELASVIEETVPYAKVAIAHGQMQPAELERVMMRFLEKKSNVLLCTKIIESGLDIPSVNTIIINRADNFGLAELYQLRGRVGRSNLRSFAYLITPPQSTLTKQAVRRLHALEEFTELGSGMNLALKDLEIRGAGNLLGKEQSGFISEIGFDMYMQILDEAVSELDIESIPAENIPKETVQKLTQLRERSKKRREVVLESDISMFIPEHYIDDENTRLEIYQRLSEVDNGQALSGIKDELIDRFGKLPPEVESLFKHLEMKFMLAEKSFEKIVIAGNTVELFIDLNVEETFTGGYFERVVNYLSMALNNSARVKQSKKSLSIQFRIINSDNSPEKLTEIYDLTKNLSNL
jgi:transcription-repair coupling factor (superfamily II helicase)